jgi:hypothetical protein
VRKGVYPTRISAGRWKPATAVIFIKERFFAMIPNDPTLRNPLRCLGGQGGEVLAPGQFGGVLARAGVGKTALMVQIALNAMLNARNVLHVSLNQPVTKAGLWYQDLFTHIAAELEAPHSGRVWEALLPHRFIMTFRTEGFSIPRLEERLGDLIEQRIFIPQMMIVDGLSFDEPVRDMLSDLKKLARLHGLQVWFSIRTHRHEDPGPGGLPKQLADVEDLFSVALQLLPAGQEIQVVPLKGAGLAPGDSRLVLDPVTMLVKNRAV